MRCGRRPPEKVSVGGSAGAAIRSVRSPRAACASRRGGFAVAVAQQQDVDRRQVVGQAELLAHGLGFEHTDPQRVEPLRRGGQHHVVGDDRGVDVGDLLAVVLALPHLVGVGADDDGARRAEVARAAREPLQPFGRLHDDEPLRLAVGSRGRHAGGFEDVGQFFGFDLRGRVFAAGVPLFRQGEKIHLHRGFIAPR